MPRCPFKGELRWCHAYKQNMHAIAYYKRTVKGKKKTYAVYSDLIHVLGKKFRANLKEDDQNVICITGQPGSGKSTLGIHLAKAIQPDWTLESGYIYDDEDLGNKMALNSHNQVFLFDEASLALNSRDSMRTGSRNIIAVLDTCRSRHNSIIFCLPAFEDLNKSVRERLCQCRIRCAGREDTIVPGYSGRGFFQVYKPVRQEFGDTFWKLIATGIFPKLTPQESADYNKIKLQNQNEFLARIQDRDEEDYE